MGCNTVVHCGGLPQTRLKKIGRCLLSASTHRQGSVMEVLHPLRTAALPLLLKGPFLQVEKELHAPQQERDHQVHFIPFSACISSATSPPSGCLTYCPKFGRSHTTIAIFSSPIPLLSCTPKKCGGVNVEVQFMRIHTTSPYYLYYLYDRGFG